MDCAWLLLACLAVATEPTDHGTDLVVGARTGSVQLMLYSVFRVGSATNNIRMSSLEAIAQHRAVAWVVPLSLGDTHHGYPVLGTTAAIKRLRDEAKPPAMRLGT